MTQQNELEMLKRIHIRLRSLVATIKQTLAATPASRAIKLTDENRDAVCDQVAQEWAAIRDTLVYATCEAQALAKLYVNTTGETPAGVRNVLDVATKVLVKVVPRASAAA